jgi:uncharacterized protein (TIGR00369 family)
MTHTTIFHSTCFACGASNDEGLQLKFQHTPDGSTCSVSVSPRYQSYEGHLHGGIVTTLLDAAMIHTVMGEGAKDPLTCRLEVRFLRPVPPGELLTVIAQRAGSIGRVRLARAEILYSGVCCARARGAFTLHDMNSGGIRSAHPSPSEVPESIEGAIHGGSSGTSTGMHGQNIEGGE